MAILDELYKLLPNTEIILTAGNKGAYYRSKNETIYMPAEQVEVVDTTAAGDTFIGYFLAARMQGKTVRKALSIAVHASAVCISKKGAMDAIPLFHMI